MSNWDGLERVVARQVLDDAKRVSARLHELGVPHALVGGLAVGLHGHPRATRDVDFLVGPTAFATTEPLLTYRPELAGVVQWGVIDLIAALPEDPVLLDEVRIGPAGSIPVISVEALIVMKLRAARAQDLADVEALVRSGADIAAVLSFLRAREARHVPAFSAIAQRVISR